MAFLQLTLTQTSEGVVNDTFEITTNLASHEWTMVLIRTNNTECSVYGSFNALPDCFISDLAIEGLLGPVFVEMLDYNISRITFLTSSVTSATIATSGLNIGFTSSVTFVDESYYPNKSLLVRSPHHLYVGDSYWGDTDGVNLDMYIYSGERVFDRPSTPSVSIRSVADDNTSGLNFNISELVKDYIQPTYRADGIARTDNYFVDIFPTAYYNGTSFVTTPFYFRSYLGYGYFEQGVNPTINTTSLLSGNRLIVKKGGDIEIPVDRNKLPTVYFYNNDELKESIVYSADDRSTEQTKYTRFLSYQTRVIEDGGVYEDNCCLHSFINNNDYFDINRIVIDSTLGIENIVVENVEEHLYEPIRVTFINKNGAFERIWFFKNNQKEAKYESEKYNANILTNNSYNTFDHQSKVLFKTSKESLKISSGFYPESFNDALNQLILSETVWITYKGQELPVNITNSSMKYQTRLDEKLINHILELDFAFDKINSIG